MSAGDDQEFGGGSRAPVLAVALRSRCPRCGRGPLFQGFLATAPRCTECGLDLSKVDTGDGPAVFVILIVGFLVVAAALITEVIYEPPYWLQLALWLPLTLILCLGLLRPVKAFLIAMQYRHKAAEGRRAG